MQRVGQPFAGQSSNQPLVWQAFITGRRYYYGEKGCCWEPFQLTYLYSWLEVHGRFGSHLPAWNPRLLYVGETTPGGGHDPGACRIEQPDEWDLWNFPVFYGGEGLHGLLAVNTADYTYSMQIGRDWQQSAIDIVDDACPIVLMSMGWFDDFGRCANEPRQARLRPFFHQYKFGLHEVCP